MNVRLFTFLTLISMAGLMTGCSKKAAEKQVQKQVAATIVQAPAIHQGTIPAGEKTVEKKDTPIETHNDITTAPGFLGKGYLLSQDVAREIERGIGAETKSYTYSFTVHNVSGVPLYTSCFAYVKKRLRSRWSWRKTDVLEIKPGEKKQINVSSFDDPQDRTHVFGCLGVFTLHSDAENSTYESLRNEQKLDLDLLSDIEGKIVVIGIERYGYQEPFYDFDFVETQNRSHGDLPELDFFVQNKTGKPVLVCGFIYSKKAKGRWHAHLNEKDDMSVWRFYKTKLLRLDPGQTGYIDVDTIFPQRDRAAVRGALGVFDPNDEETALKKTFESLSEKESLDLGELNRRRGRTIILEVERYGVENDIVDFTVKPINWIDFTKIVR